MRDSLLSLEDTVSSIFAHSTQERYWEHTKRVLSYATHIGKAESADQKILIPAVLLHDVGMTVDASFTGHVQKSKLLARGILKDQGYDEVSIQRIADVIRTHHPRPGENLEFLEQKVLYDADNMDIIGVFGVLRWIGTLPATRQELLESVELFLSIVDKCVDARGSLFFTNTARKMADETVEATVEYYRKLKRHLDQFKEGYSIVSPVSF